MIPGITFVLVATISLKQKSRMQMSVCAKILVSNPAIKESVTHADFMLYDQVIFGALLITSLHIHAWTSPIPPLK